MDLLRDAPRQRWFRARFIDDRHENFLSPYFSVSLSSSFLASFKIDIIFLVRTFHVRYHFHDRRN